MVEGLEVVGDLLRGLAQVELLLDPDGHRVADQRLGGGADDVAAVVAAVERLVEGHLHPAVDVTLDRVAVGGLRLVVLRHPGEVHVLVVRHAVVRLPQGAVVDAAVGGRDLVVQGTGDVGRAAVRRGALEPRVGVLLVAELHEHDEHRVGALALQLDELTLLRPCPCRPWPSCPGRPALPSTRFSTAASLRADCLRAMASGCFGVCEPLALSLPGAAAADGAAAWATPVVSRPPTNRPAAATATMRPPRDGIRGFTDGSPCLGGVFRAPRASMGEWPRLPHPAGGAAVTPSEVDAVTNS